jgi:hypothetical protein
MARFLAGFTFAVALLGLGWSVGRAQTTAPDFELVVTRHQGGADVQVECKRGCRLGYVTNTGEAKPTPKDVGFACKNEARCDIPVAGWVQR